MLKIRAEQIEVLRQAMLGSFETEMVIHCHKLSPQLCKAIGEQQVYTAVHQLITQAQRYGFTHKGPIRLFVEMGLLFGSAFDTDPQYPWAKEILISNRESDSQMQTAQHLYEKSLDYLEKVSGTEDIFTRQALKRFLVLVQQPLIFSPERLVSDILRETASIYPEKASYVGDIALEQLIQKAIHETATYDMVTTHSIVLFYVLMFAFGHGCSQDPFYPWITRTLQDERIVDPIARSNRLEKKALTWLDFTIAKLV